MNPSWLPSRCRWCSDVAVSESKSRSPSKTHHEIYILRELLQKSIGFTKIEFSNSSVPRGHQDFDRCPPKWFLPITCTVWLRLEFQGLDSACFFNTQFWYFQPPGPFWDPRIRIWVPAGPGTLFGKKRPGKYDFALEMVPDFRMWGFPRPKWIVWYPGGLWASQFPPKPSQKMRLQAFSQFLGIGGDPPSGVSGLPIRPLRAKGTNP